MIKPPKVSDGTVALVSPGADLADAFPHRVERAKLFLTNRGYETKEYETTTKPRGYGREAARERAETLMEAFTDPDVDVILPTTGGFRSNMLLPHLDFEQIAENPTVLLGYSDTTALQIAIHERADVVTYLMYSLGGEFELEYENKRDLHSMGGQESLDLPTPEELPSVPFRKVLLERRSHRDFDGAYISRQELAEILHYTVAPTRQTRSQVSEDSDPELSEYFSVAFLTSKLPLVVSRVKDVQPGVYYYDIQNHELVTYQQFEDATEADSKVADVANGQQFGNRVAVTFFPTVHYEDYRKFVGGPRSMYGVYQTASIITHRLMLVGTALEYQTWTSTAINESDTNEMLGLEWPELSALSLLSIGE